MKADISPQAAARRVRYRNLSVPEGAFHDRLVATFKRVIESGQLIMGSEVETFERTVAQYCGTKYSIGVGSGTSAIYLALKALGVGKGDEVITTPMSWIATLNAICATGATPKFVDIREDFNINPDAVAAAVTSKTRAIVPVHYTGRICEMEPIIAAANKVGAVIVEDAAQVMGATRADGKRPGCFGNAGAFSLNPMKVLCGFGDAGSITTSDAGVVEKVQAYRYLGTVNKETCIDRELNHKIDTIQAALLCDSFSVLDEAIESRRRIAERYDSALRDIVTCPPIPNDRSAIFFDYTIMTDRRDELFAYMEKSGVEVKIRHPLLMPDQPAYLDLPRPDIPVARKAVARIISLPCHEKLSDEDVEYVIENVRRFFGARA